MTKINVLWILLDTIFLIVFNAFFFLLKGFVSPSSVWISYMFIHFAYIVLILSPWLVRKGKSSSVFGFSIYSICSAYFLLELLIGAIFIILSPERFTTAFLVQLTIAGAFAILLLGHMISNEYTASAEESREVEIQYVKSASSQLAGINAKTLDFELKKKIEKAFDAVNSSPVKSHQAVKELEMEILTILKDLEKATKNDDVNLAKALADSALDLIEDRNRQLKQLQ